MPDTDVFYTALALLSFFFLIKVSTRLKLSRAKHPSVRGHSKWARRIAKWVPYFSYDEEAFFSSDEAPIAVVNQRKKGFKQLSESLACHSPKSTGFYASLEDSVSDVRFTNLYRVPYPYRNYLGEHIKPASIVTESSGVMLKDLDGRCGIDLSGSYGVNVFGYDFYKSCLKKGFENAQNLGPVLGPYHPIIKNNVEELKRISGLDEVSFHMSGTEAVMQAVRLARYHTGKRYLVRFCGAYHGWWDGVQPGIGNQRKTNDVYTLRDMSERTLSILRTRRDIACVLVNPLQGLHPNSDASSDAMLVNSERAAAFDNTAYSEWLQKLQQVCKERSIVLIFDEVFTGFRLSHKGAQGFFAVQADLVTYGKTVGGGLPVGVLCGRHHLMQRFKEDRPANVSFARGTFNSHPYVMTSMDAFLQALQTAEIQRSYQVLEQVWNDRVQQMNQALKEANVPVKMANLSSILTVLYTQPSRYNWMYQYYLRNEGILLSWIGTGRLIMSHNFTDEEFAEVIKHFVSAGLKMKKDGWWWQHSALTNKWIKRRMLKDMVKSVSAKRLVKEAKR
ncbi:MULTISPECIES: aminotransferase class III-fold pyridoxal phosphate-dependent enzyme [Cycloclasticus]|uniref:Class III aminotransferase n=1 Tax=Cycloclasticus pugetii TaxID=34068 RepID=A0AB33YZX1_9GAMM|nr:MULTISPECIES: aminotransferase class III-fold pyridoxal phosphate-dependent enzyme [Cycloclasticus]ATI02247.1 aminotransferase class III-fold pyridoxal phosphate-dependent enzyme [Cycloclasticus sp. PY97N]EPD12511.1 class III aminotransferase [Cycloclasticus pugetii]